MSKDYQTLLEMWRKEKKKRQELELINESHKKLNGKLQTELTETKEDNKNLTLQINNLEKYKKEKTMSELEKYKKEKTISEQSQDELEPITSPMSDE
tara:strand:+ start:416 stop:706 length:291 start_codon:yes stop_codon:yes gene_type:complete